MSLSDDLDFKDDLAETNNNRNYGKRIDGEKYLRALGNTNLSYSFYSGPWIFGIAQPTVDDYEVRFFHVQRRDTAILLPIIWQHVYPGTTI